MTDKEFCIETLKDKQELNSINSEGSIRNIGKIVIKTIPYDGTEQSTIFVDKHIPLKSRVELIA